MKFKFNRNSGRKLIYNPEFRQRIYYTIDERKEMQKQAKKKLKNIERSLLSRMSASLLCSVTA